MSDPRASSPPAPATAVPSVASPAWALGPNVPQTQRWWLRAIGAWLMRRIGWRFEGQMPDVPQFVCIVAPHTSNLDFFVALFAKWALGFDTHWWGKDSLFRLPTGWFMRANGGIPIDRSGAHNVVDTTIEAFRTNARFALTLAPEGTRRRVQAWRTGFWHVARGAQVPICCVALDWGRHVVRLGPTTDAAESDPAAGIARIQRLYADVAGYNPAHQ